MIAVTGATGFVGRAVCSRLASEGLAHRALARTGSDRTVGVGAIGADTEWRAALAGIDTVIHLAARVHQMHEPPASALERHRAVNVAGTLRLAQEAQAAGVRRLIFVSSIKVLGERTSPGRPFRSVDAPAPADPYAQSKLEAEQGLARIPGTSDLEIVVVRPPLVYGAGVGANFRALVSLVRRGVPLPLARIDNKRSLIAVDNLADLLLRCASHPDAGGGSFLCRDGEDLSTPDLIRAIGAAEGRPVRMFAAPVWGLRAVAGPLGQAAAIDRLSESLQVDDTDTRHRLDWHPPLNLREALAKAAATGWTVQ